MLYVLHHTTLYLLSIQQRNNTEKATTQADNQLMQVHVEMAVRMVC